MYKTIIIKFTIISILSILLSGCIGDSCKKNVDYYAPDNIPLKEFIIGTWVSTSATTDNGEIIDFIYQIEFVNDNTVRFLHFYQDGHFVDGETLPYAFIAESKIFVDNKRISGGEIWLLERESQELIIQRMIGMNNIILKLKHGTVDCYYDKLKK